MRCESYCAAQFDTSQDQAPRMQGFGSCREASFVVCLMSTANRGGEDV